MSIENNAIYVCSKSFGVEGSEEHFMWMIWGSWPYNGVYKSWVSVESEGFIVSRGKEKPSMTMEGTLHHITKKYFFHKTKDCCLLIRYCLL